MSLVNPRAVPRLSDAEQVSESIAISRIPAAAKRMRVILSAVQRILIAQAVSKSDLNYVHPMREVHGFPEVNATRPVLLDLITEGAEIYTAAFQNDDSTESNLDLNV